MEPLVLSIEGMSCGHCLNAVSRALSETPGVTIKSVRIGRAELDFDPATVDAAKIVAAVGTAGYPAVAVGASGDVTSSTPPAPRPRGLPLL